MNDTNLVILKLTLDIPNFWENDLKNTFPKNYFYIKKGFFRGNQAFGGLLKIEGQNISNINSFFKKKHPHVFFDYFHPDSNLFYFLDSNSVLPKIFNDTKGIINWSSEFLNHGKNIKLILDEREVNSIINSIEKNNIDIKKFSKTKANFDIQEILTPKQKEILIPCLKNGYYDFPKKINLNNLAKKIGISPSTLCVHLQKIESKILNIKNNEIILENTF